MDHQCPALIHLPDYGHSRSRNFFTEGDSMGRTRIGARLCPGILIGLTIFLSATSAMAGGVRLESLSVRAGLSGNSVIGEDQQTDFNQIDLALAARLPWEWRLGSSEWVVATRALTSAGALRGAGETNGVFTLVPFDVMFGRRDGLISLDMGVGGALITDQKFGDQNFGGPFQFVWTFGATSRFAGPLGVGYHFQHYSDAGMYGEDSRGVDLHLLELIYWFETGK
jgi:hypothetical protein